MAADLDRISIFFRLVLPVSIGSNLIDGVVHIDADKEQYPLYFDLIVDRVRSGGLIIADNVLWSGKVMESAVDEATQSLQVFNKKVNDDKRVETVILPVRDGLTLLRKI